MVRFYVDVETTGLEPSLCSIFQLSGIIIHDGVEEEFNFRMRPYRGETISEEASKKTGITQEELDTYPDQAEVFIQWLQLLNKHININDFKNRAYFIGYNSDFDRRFIRSWHEFNQNDKMGWYFFFPDIDVMRIAAFFLMGKTGQLRSFKQETVYKYITGKELKGAHDSMNDIRATKEILDILAQEYLFPSVQARPQAPLRTAK